MVPPDPRYAPPPIPPLPIPPPPPRIPPPPAPPCIPPPPPPRCAVAPQTSKQPHKATRRIRYINECLYREDYSPRVRIASGGGCWTTSRAALPLWLQ